MVQKSGGHPVELGSLSHDLQSFFYIPGGAAFLNHQQYDVYV